MSRPTLAEHDKRLALIEHGMSRDNAEANERREAILDAIKDLTSKVDSLAEKFENDLTALEDRQTKTETRLDTLLAEAKGTVRGVKIGWAGAFAVLGAGLFAGINKILELF